ncbi:hypothetical protein [Paenibacillus sp. MBLB4367]|uniref:hypothetical protein n=1 Tax=Paenibacillus sp. MBLB4367 TaxID=3384767 RepID=UPI00390803B9
MKLIALTMLKVIVLTVLFACLYSLQPKTGYACSCAGPLSVQQELQSKTAVFSGKAVSVNVQKGLLRSSADPVAVTLEVDRVWKGEIGRKQTVYTAMDGASCGFKFETGREYVIYAHSGNDKLETSICSRTKLLSAAAEDSKLLGAGQPPGPDNREASGSAGIWLMVSAFAMMGAVSFYVIFRYRKRMK